MAYQRIQSNAVTLNGIVYESEYDLSNGKTRIIQTNAPTGTQPIYQDGNFTAEATKIGLTDVTQRQNIHNSISTATRTAHSAAGGTPKGHILPQSAQLNNQGAAPGSNLATPASNPDPNNVSANTNNGFITAGKAIAELPSNLDKITKPFD